MRQLQEIIVIKLQPKKEAVGVGLLFIKEMFYDLLQERGSMSSVSNVRLPRLSQTFSVLP